MKNRNTFESLGYIRLSPSAVRHKFKLLNAASNPVFAARLLSELSRSTFATAVKAFDVYYPFRSSFIHQLMLNENLKGLKPQQTKMVTLISLRLEIPAAQSSAPTPKPLEEGKEHSPLRQPCGDSDTLSVASTGDKPFVDDMSRTDMVQSLRGDQTTSSHESLVNFDVFDSRMSINEEKDPIRRETLKRLFYGYSYEEPPDVLFPDEITAKRTKTEKP